MMRNAFHFVLLRLLIVSMAWPISCDICFGQSEVAETTSKSTSQLNNEYLQWLIQQSKQRPARTQADGLKLILMAVEGEQDARELRKNPFGTKLVQYGTTISVDGTVSHFSRSQRGTKGCDGKTMGPEQLKQLDELLSKLPEDGGRLPVADRRLIVAISGNQPPITRVYDRADLPDVILDIAKLCRVAIRVWIPEFKAETEIEARQFEHGGFFCLSPNGKQMVLTSLNGPIQFWDPVTRHSLGKIQPAQGTPLDAIAYSPDGTLAALSGRGECALVDTEKWQRIKLFAEPMVDRTRIQLSEPRFTRDGMYLTLQSSEPSLRVFKTSTWEPVTHLPDIPENTVRYYPAPRKRLAVVQTSDGAITLWNPDQKKAVASLDDGCILSEAVFSPDECLLATVTEVKWNQSRLRLWSAETGMLVRELHVFEKPVCERIFGPLWSPDGKWLFAATKSHSFFTSESISVWNLKTGKHHGELVGCPTKTVGVVLLRDGTKLVAGGADGKIRFWDTQSAINQIQNFEDSLPSNHQVGSTAVKH